jgi:hypothetical protein
MARLSRSPEEWSESAVLSDRRYQGWRRLITFGDQNLYFVQGHYASCFEISTQGGLVQDHRGQTRAWSRLVIDKAMSDWRS